MLARPFGNVLHLGDLRAGVGGQRDESLVGDQGDRREVARRREAGVLERVRQDRHGVVVGQQQRLAVRRGGLEGLRRDQAAGTGPVLDDDGLVERGRQAFGKDAGRCIQPPPGESRRGCGWAAAPTGPAPPAR
jgi:hypothetical protein